jgi:hypothetical protein
MTVYGHLQRFTPKIIDGKYALFEYDAKNALLKYIFDDEKLNPDYHRLKLTISDRCNNKSIYEHAFSR